LAVTDSLSQSRRLGACIRLCRLFVLHRFS